MVVPIANVNQWCVQKENPYNHIHIHINSFVPMAPPHKTLRKSKYRCKLKKIYTIHITPFIPFATMNNPYNQTFDNGRPSQSQSGYPASDLTSQNQQMLALMARTPQQPQNQFARPIGSLYVPGYAASPGASDMYGRPSLGALPPPPSGGTRDRTGSFMDNLFSSSPQQQQQQPGEQKQTNMFGFGGGKSRRRQARKAAKRSRKSKRAMKAAKRSRKSKRAMKAHA